MYQNSPFNPQAMDNAGNIDAVLSDASGQMARAQLQRHISNSSSTIRRRSSRITKPVSAGSSPQVFQRRRATTQTIPRHRASLYQQCLQVNQGGMEGIQRQSMPANTTVRPSSWHPSTLIGNSLRPQSNYEASFQGLHPSYATHAVENISIPNTQPEFSMNIGSSPWQTDGSLSSLYQQSRDYEVQGVESARSSFVQDGYFDNSYPQYTLPFEQALEGYPVFSPVPYPLSTWTSSLSTFSAQTAPSTPEYLPIQNPSETGQNKPAKPTSLPRKDSKELIGMGLYDVPDRNSWSLESMLDGPTNLFSHRPESMGKGLKLEETWEPPEEEDETDTEEQEEDEEEEEEEEEEESQNQQDPEGDAEIYRLAEGALGLGSENQRAQAPQRPPSMLNQSFFFETDESYAAGFGARNMWQGQIPDYCVR